MPHICSVRILKIIALDGRNGFFPIKKITCTKCLRDLNLRTCLADLNECLINHIGNNKIKSSISKAGDSNLENILGILKSCLAAFD